MIFQDPMSSLNPVFTIGDQIGEILRLQRGLGRRAARARAVELLDRVGIPSPRRRLARLPARAQRRHAPAGDDRDRDRAAGPKLLLADEPTTALDVTIQDQILALLAELQREIGMAIDPRLPRPRRDRRRTAIASRSCTRATSSRTPRRRRSSERRATPTRAPCSRALPSTRSSRRRGRLRADPRPAARPRTAAARLPVPAALPERRDACTERPDGARRPPAPGHVTACPFWREAA